MSEETFVTIPYQLSRKELNMYYKYLTWKRSIDVSEKEKVRKVSNFVQSLAHQTVVEFMGDDDDE